MNKHTLALALAAFCTQASAQNLLLNGDFAQTYAPQIGINQSLPTSWSGLQGQTDNASVVDGTLLFSTSGTHSATLHKYYVYQSFDVGPGGDFLLTFDYQLRNSYSGYVTNGANVVIDNWYTTPTSGPNTVFSETYGHDFSQNGVNYGQWKIGQTVRLNLNAGQHTLYLGTLGPSRSGDQAAVIYDNVSLSAAVASVPEPESHAMFLSGLSLIGVMVWRRARRC